MIDMSALGVQSPASWDTATNVATNFANGMPTANPTAWNTAQQGATQMSKTGDPTNYEPWYQQAKGVPTTDIADAIKQAAEQAGLKGNRWSSTLGRTAQDIAGRTMANVGTQWTQQQMTADEAAKQRQMDAYSQLFNIGQGQTGLTEAAKNRALEATGQLGTLGQMNTDYLTKLAQQAYDMGTGMQNISQQDLQNIYQDWQRLIPENSPWNQQILSLLGVQSPTTASTYGSSLGTSLLSILGSVLGGLATTSSVQYKKDISLIHAKDEQKIASDIISSPLFSYRYKFEDQSKDKHLGLITEVAPSPVVVMDKMIGLYEYAAALHATIKTLNERIKVLEDKNALL